MMFSFSDGLLLAVVALSVASSATPTLASALEARKATRLSRVVAAGGRLAATIAVELRAVPVGATAAETKARLIDRAVQQLKSPELMGATIAKLGGTDAGVRNIVAGELAKLELGAAAEAALPPPADAEPAIPLTPAVPPSAYPPGGSVTQPVA